MCAAFAIVQLRAESPMTNNCRLHSVLAFLLGCVQDQYWDVVGVWQVQCHTPCLTKLEQGRLNVSKKGRSQHLTSQQ